MTSPAENSADEVAGLKQRISRLQLELSQNQHASRNLYSEFDCCTITYDRMMHPMRGSNINHLFGTMLTSENVTERFAVESRPYFSRLWTIVERMRAAPGRSAETGWQEFTAANDPRLDFTRWLPYGSTDWQTSATEAYATPAVPGAQEFMLGSTEALIPPRTDFRLSYTAWSDPGRTPCELSVVVGAGLLVRHEIRGILQDPSENGYCFAFGAYDNTMSLLQRSLRSMRPNPLVRIEPGRRHRVEAEQIGGRFRLLVDGVVAVEMLDITPLVFPQGAFISLYCSNPFNHFSELSLRLRPSSLSEEEWDWVDGVRRQTLKYVHGGRDRYFDARIQSLSGSAQRPEFEEIHLFFKEVTEAVTEHLAAERHRQAEEALRQSNAVLEGKIAERTRELNQVLDKLRASEQRFALAALGSNDGVWDWNLETNTVHFSPRWKEILGYTDKEIPNTLPAWYGLVEPEDLSPLKQALEAHFAGGTASFEHEYRMRHKDGAVRWVLTRGAAIRNQAGAPLRIAGSQTDISSRKSTELTLRHDAMHDPLTGLPNRATFRLKVAEAMHLRDREGKNFAILFLDLDGFKSINDSLGHLFGDQVLIGIARRLEGVVRPGDVVARLGGDEFVVLLNEISGKNGVDRVAERILNAFESPFAIQGQQIPVGASIGIAIGRKQFATPEEIIRKADSAMYHVKMAKKK